jgi:hypothetical protein
MQSERIAQPILDPFGEYGVSLIYLDVHCHFDRLYLAFTALSERKVNTRSYTVGGRMLVLGGLRPPNTNNSF